MANTAGPHHHHDDDQHGHGREGERDESDLPGSRRGNWVENIMQAETKNSVHKDGPMIVCCEEFRQNRDMKKIRLLAFSIIALFIFCDIALASESAHKSVVEYKYITGTREGDYQLAEKMLNCAAFFKFASELATKANMPANAEQAINKFHGWRMAAMLPLISGLADDKKTEAMSISETMTELKNTEYRGRIELNGAPEMTKINDEFTQNCMPLAPLQERIVNSMRSGN